MVAFLKGTMRFHTRAFLFSFLPFAALLVASFLIVQSLVQATVRAGLRDSLRETQRTVGVLRDLNTVQIQHFLETAGPDPEVKLALGVLAADKSNITAQSALEDRLQGLVRHSGIDLMLVTGADGQPMAGVVRDGGTSEFMEMYAFPDVEEGGLLLFRGEPFQTVAVPVAQDGVGLGSMIVGTHLDLTKFATSTVLMHGGVALQTDVHEGLLELGSRLSMCKDRGECKVELSGKEWMSLPILEGSKRIGWKLYSLVNVDDALTPVGTLLHRTFLTVTALAWGLTLVCSLAFSRAVVQPLAVLVSHLREAAATGNIAEFDDAISPVVEIAQLARSYNSAAASVKEGRNRLQSAYVEFVYSLARALDARDRYTAGHSERVSNLSCALAAALDQDDESVERIRIGALLHDIGKIGISDTVLQKPGRLTEEEFKTIKKHPVIGRRILKGVQGFAPYLPAVELHHENWDGSGYPNRQAGREVPIDARIIHVADAYDAMTTNRSYRQAMTHDRAMEILAECAGTQFDPEVVAAMERVFEGETASFFSKEPLPEIPPSLHATGTVVATANMDVPHLVQ
jgi:HD-GYP domain-containing protein (c-di-GMP phosphodiesterase class II)